jgi:hypothetical protein
MRKIALIWSLGAGAMDAVTGLLLVFAPEQVLELLGIAVPSAESLVFLSWIGVFVASVGLSYVLVLRGGAAAATVWIFTALVRLAVAAFLVAQIRAGRLPMAWATVALADAMVACLQIIGLRLGCWTDRGV